MRGLSVAAAVVWAASACAAEPAQVFIQVKDDADLTWVKAHPRPEEDARALEAALIPGIEKWGLSGTRLSPEGRGQLRDILAQTSREIPLRFHYFSSSAGRFDAGRLSEIFMALLRGPDDFKALVTSWVGFIGDKAQTDEKSGADARASQDVIAKDDSGQPRLNMAMSSDGGCSIETLFDGAGGEPCSDSGRLSVAAGGDSRAIDAAEPETESQAKEDAPVVSAYAPARAVGPAEPQ